MKNKLRKFFFKAPENWKFWLAVALVFKGILFFLRIIQGAGDERFPIPGFLGFSTADSMSYFAPIESLLSSGNYGIPQRMPGYGAIYMMFRLFCSQGAACNFVIILQYVLASVSVYCLALLVESVTNSKRLFYAVFYLFLLSSYSNWMDVDIMSESFCTTFLLFSAYFLVKYFKKSQFINLIYSGTFLTWCIFIRPFFLPILIFYVVLLIFQSYRVKLPMIKAVMLFILPFIIIDGVWTVRNYKMYKEVIPLTIHPGALPNLNDLQMSSVSFLQSWGGDFNTGDEKSVYHWFGFMSPPVVTTYKGEANPIPDNIYTSKFNKDSLVSLKKLCTTLNDSSSFYGEKKNLLISRHVIDKFNEYTLSVKKEQPFIYYIKAPFAYVKEILTFPWVSYNVIGYSAYHKGVFNYANNLNYVIVKIFKLNPINWLYMIFNYLIVITGLLGAVLLIVSGLKNPLILIFPVISLFTVLGHPVLLRMVANRFIMPAWPFLLVCAGWYISVVFNKFYSKKLTS